MASKHAPDLLAQLVKKKGRKKGKKARKLGRYSRHPSSVRYRADERWKVNKVRKLKRHLKAHPSDDQAVSALARRS